ncbi:hypothetical protein [Rosettibacter firmus]|uniref:hypothetical protein n=1 Tax=Rosettibacter firmus TaxID=3111522 RepID=UPI00336C2A1C
MADKEINSLLIQKLSKDLSLPEESLPVNAEQEHIRKYLIEKIKEMMSQNFDRFIINLYRIDVDENKVHKILHSKDKTNIPEKLADLIIERQLLRIKTQLMYKKGEL